MPLPELGGGGTRHRTGRGASEQRAGCRVARPGGRGAVPAARGGVRSPGAEGTCVLSDLGFSVLGFPWLWPTDGDGNQQVVTNPSLTLPGPESGGRSESHVIMSPLLKREREKVGRRGTGGHDAVQQGGASAGPQEHVPSGVTELGSGHTSARRVPHVTLRQRGLLE